MSKSIEINYLGDSGYEALYPSTMLSSVLDWQENLYSKDEILDSATKALFGLGTDAVPDDVFKVLSGCPIFEVGQYIGNGQYAPDYKNSISFDFEPKFLFVQRQYGFSTPVAYLTDGFFWIDGMSKYQVYGGPNENFDRIFIEFSLSADKKTIFWEISGEGDGKDPDDYQLNSNYGQYYYIAFGMV